MFEIIPARTEKGQTILDWYRRRSKINFDPEYQRVGRIWDIGAKQLFIDSLINGFDVPKFYFHTYLFLKDHYQYSIIDGKQRILTVFDFIDNNFALSTNFKYYKDGYSALAGMRYLDIASKYPKIIAEFDQYVIDVVQVVTDEEDKIQELFLRLNEGTSLNNSEKRLARTGDFNSSVKDFVVRHRFFGGTVSFPNRRYDYEELLTKLILIEQADGVVSLSKSKLDKIVDENKISSYEIDQLFMIVESNLHKMSEVFNGMEKILSQKAIVPIYYLFIRNNLGIDTESIQQFIREFEQLKSINRKQKYNELIAVLIEFDRLNQQGANSMTSLRERLIIMTGYYMAFRESGRINLSTTITIGNLELDES